MLGTKARALDVPGRHCATELHFQLILSCCGVHRSQCQSRPRCPFSILRAGVLRGLCSQTIECNWEALHLWKSQGETQAHGESLNCQLHPSMAQAAAVAVGDSKMELGSEKVSFEIGRELPTCAAVHLGADIQVGTSIMTPQKSLN